MTRYVIGNWKSHKSSDDGRRWFDKFAAIYRPHSEVQVIIAPSMVSLESIALYLRGLGLDNVFLAAQNFNIPESPEKVAKTVLQLQQMFPAYPVVYGGALFPGNVQAYLQLAPLAGIFVGSSSLKPEQFVDICSQAALSG